MNGFLLQVLYAEICMLLFQSAYPHLQCRHISVYHLSPLSFVGGFETAESDLIPRFHLGKVSVLHQVLLKEYRHSVFRERERQETKNPGFSFFVCIFFFYLSLIFAEVRSNNF